MSRQWERRIRTLVLKAQAILDAFTSWNFARPRPIGSTNQTPYPPARVKDTAELFDTLLYQHVGDDESLVTPSNLLFPATLELLAGWIRDVRQVASTTYAGTHYRYDFDFRYNTKEAEMVAFVGGEARYINEGPWDMKPFHVT